MLPSLQDQTAQQTHGEADLQPGGEHAQDDGGHDDFNDNNDTLKAQIKFEKDGYYIDIDTINDENFNTNNKLRIRE